MNTISFLIFDSPIGPIGIAHSQIGLTAVELRCPPVGEFAREMEKRYSAEAREAKQTAPLRRAAKQILEYLDGKREVFDIPLDLRGPDFMVGVCRQMMKILYGKTTSYGELASKIGRPKAARAVGRAVGANPIPIIIPCHRVIGASGALTGFGSGLDIKAFLLDLEQKTKPRINTDKRRH